MPEIHAEEGNSTGLVGLSERTIDNGKFAPNGYMFETSAPDRYTGVVSFSGSSDGQLGIRSTSDSGYASWEMRPAVKLPPGGPYTASVNVKHSGLTSKPNICLEVFSFDAVGKPTLLSHILHKNAIVSQWHAVSGEFMVPADSAYLRVRVDLTSSGEMFFKDLRVGKPQVDARTSESYDEAKFEFRQGFAENASGIAGAELPVRRTAYDGNQARVTEATELADTPEGLRFTINGEAGITRSMQWEKKFTPHWQLNDQQYYSLRYREKGILRTSPKSYVIRLNGINAAGETVSVDLLNTAITFDDGEFHRVVGKIPDNLTATDLSVQFKTADDQAVLEFAALSFSSMVPHTKCADAVWHNGFAPIELTGLYNSSAKNIEQKALEKYGILQDLNPMLDVQDIEIAGIPFRLSQNPEKNVITPPFNDQANKAAITFLGEPNTRANVAPISRNDSITIPVGRSAAALYLLTLHANNPIQNLFAAAPRALRLDDMENLTVELVYSDGTTSKAFPYSLFNKAFYLSGRFTDVFAVAADPAKILNHVTLYFYAYTVSFQIAAATVSERAPDFAVLLNPPITQEYDVQIPAETKPAIHLNGKVLKINGFDFSLDNGFSAIRLPNGQMSPGSGVAVRLGNDSFTGRNFNVTAAEVTDGNVKLLLTGKNPELSGVQMEFMLTPNEWGGILWRGSVQNSGQEKRAIVVSMGAVSELSFGEKSTDSIFFPRFRTEIVNDYAFFRANYGQEFLHQFMDLFNPEKQCGLMIMADNRANEKLEFLAAKQESGLSASISLQTDYAALEPGSSKTLPPVLWQPHTGDWHTAAKIYKQRWLDQYYASGNAQNNDILVKSWCTTAYQTTDLARRWFHVPPLLSSDKKRWLIDEVNQFELGHLEHRLDFVHLWWSFNDAENRFMYGNWSSDKFYAQAGGLASFKEAIRHYQEDLGIAVSLYTLSDRCTNTDMPADFDRKAVALAYPDGSPLINDTETYTCFECDQWSDYAVKDLAKLMRDTGAKILYSDVLCSFNGTKCYSQSHGHEVPSNSLKGDLNFISKLRAAMPEDRAIWTEYGLPDTISMYSDAFISYYFMELQEYFAPVRNRSDRRNEQTFDAPFAIVRYLLPKYRLIDLPCGIEGGNKPSQIDYALLNGDLFQEDTWFLHESRLRERINRGLKIKVAYSDCFLSENPIPRVQTAMGGITANCFPGSNRTIWTLINTTAITRSGVMLKLPHYPGARYRDLWNELELTPEIIDGMAQVSLALDPQAVGVVVQY